MPSEVRILPSPPRIEDEITTERAGIAQLVEREPSKLGVAGSSPVSRSTIVRSFGKNAHVAQSAEHFLGKEEVMGPIPIVGSKNSRKFKAFFTSSSTRTSAL
jgi:hypothetical protein